MNYILEGKIRMNTLLIKPIFFVFYVVFIALVINSNALMAQSPQKVLNVKVSPYPGKDPFMWDGVYAAKNGKIYSALITEGASAYLYEYDPERDSNILLYDIAEFTDSRGKGIRTPGKIHNKPIEDNEGNIYFVQ